MSHTKLSTADELRLRDIANNIDRADHLVDHLDDAEITLEEVGLTDLAANVGWAKQEVDNGRTTLWQVFTELGGDLELFSQLTD